jgi:hypothetical protein
MSDMTNEINTKMTKEEIAKALKDWMPALSEFASNISGTKVNVKPNESDMSEMVTVVQRLLTWHESSKDIHDDDTRKKKLNEFLNIFLEADGAKGPEHPIDVYLAGMLQVFRDPPKSHFLAKTSYIDYGKAMFAIIRQAYDKGKLDEVNNYLGSMEPNDFFGLAQLSMRIIKHGKYLQKNVKKPTKKVIEKYISIYDDLAGAMEKHVTRLYGVREILRGNQPKFADIHRQNLANKVNSLKTEAPYSVLVGPLNVTIRNAIGHKGSVVIQPLTRTVMFADKQRKVILPYADFIKQTRDLGASMSMVAHFEEGITLIKFLAAKEYLG